MKLSQVPEVIAAKEKLDALESSFPVDMSTWSEDQRDRYEEADAEYSAVRKEWRTKLGA